MNKLGDAHLFGRGEITAAARSSSLTGSHFRVMPVASRRSAFDLMPGSFDERHSVTKS